jgi:hypothetical protein
MASDNDDDITNDEDWRDAGLHVLSETYPAENANSRELDQCDLSQYTFVKGHSSNTSSPTDLYIVEKDGVRYFIKAFIISNTHTEYLLLHEITYYLLTTILYEKKVIRNVVPIAQYSKKCSLQNLQDLVGPQYANNVVRNMYMITKRPNPKYPTPILPVSSDGPQYDAEEAARSLEGKAYGFIMTRVVDPITASQTPITFHEYMSGENYTYAEFIQYYAQILYTIIVFAGNGFNHNDLHVANILMDKYHDGETQFCKYECRNTGALEPLVFYTNTRYIARIFDFDRSTWSDFPNVALDADPANRRNGQSPRFMYKTDILKFTCVLFSIFARLC